MSETQVTRWRDIPSMVTAREGDETVKIQLPQRFQEAIDEAAMRLGETDADAYIAGWARDPWLAADGNPAEAAEALVAAIEAEWTPEMLAARLDAYGEAP